jgi:RNA-directed DNA polymerase
MSKPRMLLVSGQAWGEPACGPGGIRRKGGVSPVQAPTWVIDLDIQKFFDTIPHDLVMRAVGKHTQLKWVLLYVGRWLKAPLQREDGTLTSRDRGSPQGSAISPLLANLFMHYAFDSWMAKQFPDIGFERYCDDVVVHCVSRRQAGRQSTCGKLSAAG